MQKTKCKGRKKNMACLNKMKSASKTLLKQRPIHPGIASRDESGNLVKSCGSSSSSLTKQIQSKLSKSVVSLASFDGDTVVFECTGIFIEDLHADSNTASILTSANLVGSSQKGITDTLKIKVRLPTGRVVIGWLHRRDYPYDLAVVNIRRTRGFQEEHLSTSHRVQFESNSKVVAVGCCYDNGMLKFTDGTVVGPASDDRRELRLSTCDMNTAPSGCPLIDFDGNFVGVNLRRRKLTAFLPMNKILEILEHSRTTRHSAADTNDKRGSNSMLNDNWPLLYEMLDLSPEDRELFQPGNVFYKCKEVEMLLN